VVAARLNAARFAPDGNSINVLTSETLTDIGGGATFYSCLVEVEAGTEPEPRRSAAFEILSPDLGGKADRTKRSCHTKSISLENSLSEKGCKFPDLVRSAYHPGPGLKFRSRTPPGFRLRTRLNFTRQE